MRIVIVARVAHRAVDPGGVMGRNSSAEHEDVGLGRATPFLDQSRYFGDSLSGRARQRARQRVADVHLDRVDDIGAQLRAVERCRELVPGRSRGPSSRVVRCLQIQHVGFTRSVLIDSSEPGLIRVAVAAPTSRIGRSMPRRALTHQTQSAA